MDPITITSYVVTILVVAVVFLRLAPRKIVVLETSRGLLYKNGRLRRVLEPGAYWVMPWGLDWQLVDRRQRVMTVPGQEVLTGDNIGVKISLAVRYRVADPEKAVHVVEDYADSLYALTQIALRAVVSDVISEDLLGQRVVIGAHILDRVRAAATEFGVQLDATEVKDVMLSGDLKRAFSAVLKAKKEGEAALARARGESAALRNLANAAQLLEKNPALFRLRYLETIDAAGKSGGNTGVIGLPPELTVQST